MTRTQAEIVERLEARRNDDLLGFEISEYIPYLDWPHVCPYLKSDVTEEQWREVRAKVTSPKDRMVDYMPFAWEKANNCRGISAWRSIAHYQAWLWLEGEEDLAKEIARYDYYGKPQLIQICQYLGLDPAQWDDGKRVRTDE